MANKSSKLPIEAVGGAITPDHVSAHQHHHHVIMSRGARSEQGVRICLYRTTHRPPKIHPSTIDGVGVGTGLQRPFLIFRTVSGALRFLWFGAVLSSVSCWGVSYLVAQVEVCFLPEFSYFLQKSQRSCLLYTSPSPRDS